MNGYKDLIDNLNPEDIKQLIINLGGYVVKETPQYIIFPTICHNEDASEASQKLYYYKDSHFFYCFTECGGQSIFKFLENYYKTRNYEYDWYSDIYQVVCNCSTATFSGFNKKPIQVDLKDRYAKRERPKLEYYSNNVLDSFTKTYPIEWLNDGISKEAMDKFNILYSISRNKIIIPHYDIQDRLIGIRGRALNPWEVENIGKYTPVQIENIMYKHPLSLNLYGLNKNKDNIKENGYVFLFESEKSVLQVESFNMPNCAVAVCGSNFNIFQLQLLMKEVQPREIIICFDKEEKPGEEKYFNKLYKIGSKYNNYCNFSFIYDKKNLLELKDSPSDKGETVFRELLKERVRVR